jgi:thioredoxin-related protein
MNKKPTVILSSIVLLALASCGQETSPTNQETNTAQEVAVKSEPVTASAYNDFSSAPASYVQYNGQDLSAIGETTVLYFSQESCGTCQKTDADIKAQASLPDNVNILKVDFDTETELNQQYGVTTKHTFVLVDENGNEIAKEIGLATASDIADFVNSNTLEVEPIAIETSATTSVDTASVTTITSKVTEAKEVAVESVEAVTETTEVIKEEVVEKVEPIQKVVEEVIETTPVAASSA